MSGKFSIYASVQDNITIIPNTLHLTLSHYNRKASSRTYNIYVRAIMT